MFWNNSKYDNFKFVSKYQVPLIRQRMTIEDGFNSDDEALAFGNNACGAACLKMILESFGRKDVPSVKVLMEEGLRKGFYNDAVGWKHKGMVQQAKSYGVSAWNMHFGKPWQLAEKLEKNKLIIASVSLTFDKSKKGGHLVVIYGIEIKNKKLVKIYFNDPSGWGQDNHVVNGDSFLASWTGNIMFFEN